VMGGGGAHDWSVEPDDVSTHKTLFPPSGSAWAHLRQLQPRTKA
jgi:hypothetical protein